MKNNNIFRKLTIASVFLLAINTGCKESWLEPQPLSFSLPKTPLPLKVVLTRPWLPADLTSVMSFMEMANLLLPNYFSPKWPLKGLLINLAQR